MKEEMKTLLSIFRDGEKRGWSDVWMELCGNQWFLEKLERTSTWVLRQAGLPNSWKDDVRQEATLLFAKSLKRDPTLGFDESKGSVQPFISTVIYRCCQKGVRQFRNSLHQTIDGESAHPVYETTSAVDERLDLNECVSQLVEPMLSTTLRTLQGQSVENIAKSTNRSTRTIYRYIEKATEELQELMAGD